MDKLAESFAGASHCGRLARFHEATGVLPRGPRQIAGMGWKRKKLHVIADSVFESSATVSFTLHHMILCFQDGLPGSLDFMAFMRQGQKLQDPTAAAWIGLRFVVFLSGK